jgi:hypothetical protein
MFNDFENTGKIAHEEPDASSDTVVVMISPLLSEPGVASI